MGDRYYLTVVCPKCKHKEEEVWYAPTCGVMDFKCPGCGYVIDLEDNSGIPAEDCANTLEGYNGVVEMKKERGKLTPDFKPITEKDLRIRKVKYLEGVPAMLSTKLGLQDNDLVIVSISVEKIVGSPSTYLRKRYCLDDVEKQLEADKNEPNKESI